MLNLDPALSPGQLQFSNPAITGSLDLPFIRQTANNPDSDISDAGLFDLIFEFYKAGNDRGEIDYYRRFGIFDPDDPNTGGLDPPIETVSYDISGIATLTALDFVHASAPPAEFGPFRSVAKMQGLSVGGDTAWVTGPTHYQPGGVGGTSDSSWASLAPDGQDVLEIEIGGTTVGTQYDRVNVAAPTTLTGTLDLALIGAGPFVPATTDSFQIMTYPSRTGMFDSVAGAMIEPGRSFSLHYGPTSLWAIAGQWDATGMEIAGDVSVPDDELRIGGDWVWSGMLVKRGVGELILDLNGGFDAQAGAQLVVLEGQVRLDGEFSDTLSLEAVSFEELGESAVAAMGFDPANDSGWILTVVGVPEPSAVAVLAIVGVAALRARRRKPIA
jgi:hypothetical protein